MTERIVASNLTVAYINLVKDGLPEPTEEQSDLVRVLQVYAVMLRAIREYPDGIERERDLV